MDTYNHDIFYLHRNLNLQYPDFATLKSLLAGLNLPHGQSIRSRESRSPTPEEDGTTLLELQRPSSPPLPAAQLMPFRKRIGKGASLEGKQDSRWGSFSLNDRDSESANKSVIVLTALP